jgi:hypothetical protein
MLAYERHTIESQAEKNAERLGSLCGADFLFGRHDISHGVDCLGLSQDGRAGF